MRNQVVSKHLWYQKNREKILARRRRYYQENRSKVAAKNIEWRRSNPDKLATQKRRYHLKHEFGITVEQYNEMFAKQTGLCAICGLGPKSGTLVVDHNHGTGLIRGLLCHKCNVGMGHFNDDASLLGRAINYLYGESK